MTVLEYKNYRKKSLRSGKMKATFSRKKKKNQPKGQSGGAKKAAAVLVALLLIAGSAVYGSYTFLTSSGMFSIQSVEVVDTGGIENFRFDSSFLTKGKNIFTTSPAEVAKKVMGNPWVKSVKVRKVYPSRILIAVERRTPVGMINLGSLYFLDSDGVPFKKVTKYDRKVFPVFTGFSKKILGTSGGRDALKTALRVRELVKASKVSNSVAEINYRRRDGISLVLKGSGLKVKLGMRDVRGAISRLDENYERVIALSGKAGYVDLKYQGKIIVGEKKKM